MIETYIVIRTQFEAIHQWPECPFDDVAFLRVPHRHIFHIEVKFKTSSDREIEFIRMKREVQAFLALNYIGKDLGKESCETIAEKILYSFHADFVAVFEDRENGAEVARK